MLAATSKQRTDRVYWSVLEISGKGWLDRMLLDALNHPLDNGSSCCCAVMLESQRIPGEHVAVATSAVMRKASSREKEFKFVCNFLHCKFWLPWFLLAFSHLTRISTRILVGKQIYLSLCLFSWHRMLFRHKHLHQWHEWIGLYLFAFR